MEQLRTYSSSTGRVEGREEIAHFFKIFRAFLGDAAIREARSRRHLRAAGSPFRLAALQQKQPWVDAFEAFDRLTIRGSRRLPTHGIPPIVFRAAIAGRLLSRISSTFPVAVAQQMRNRLLDLDDRAEPLLMEWDAAFFYRKNGFDLHWIAGQGAEFVARKGDLRFKVECKQISPRLRERLPDWGANTLADALSRFLESRGLAGDLSLRTALTQLPDDLTARLSRGLDALPRTRLPVEIDGIGELSGDLRPFGRRLGHDALQKLLEGAAHDARCYVASLPFEGPPQADLILQIFGPQVPMGEHLANVERILALGADQLGADMPGVVLMEIQTVGDATLFRDKAPFREMNGRVFRQHPHLAAIVWRAHTHGEAVVGGYELHREAFAERNPWGVYAEAGQIPLVDPDQGD